ncbi:MAG: M57 family metalloprotease [Bacteroidota bacterium]
MKNSLNFMKLFGFCVFFLFISCENEDVGSETNDPDVIASISEELKTQLDNLALSSTEVKPYNTVYPDGTSFSGFLVGGDIMMTESDIMNGDIFADEGGIQSEQYRTTNLVSQPRTLSVIGYTGSGFALSSRGRTGLQWAINNYNRLNLGINFTLTFAASTNADIVVFDNTANNPGSAGGSAGFPSGGNPNKFVQIYGLANSSNNVNEHVVTHEIGHSIGFRHTDYFSRQSCGQNVNEGSAGVGAILIPGTPSGFDPGSIMLACFSNSTSGEFNNNDITALRFLY